MILACNCNICKTGVSAIYRFHKIYFTFTYSLAAIINSNQFIYSFYVHFTRHILLLVSTDFDFFSFYVFYVYLNIT